ncbi:hypothetical protein L3X38_009448 [Prunus dulcis]|uniref:Uncharacterized protein n=1 Tax=Prunus dulcis TaxID=3755 RepID=A0AAD4ZDW3_PRUDU|nr:hypothetical protein L3X38_009448 [Prunus dulcis]
MKMASVLAAAQARLSSQLLRPIPQNQIPITHSLKRSAVKAAPVDFGLERNVLRLKIRESWHAVSASNSNPSNGYSVEDKSGRVKTIDAAQGPPLLTIVAGFVVFFLLFWILGSILMWLIGLVVRFPPPK